MNGSVLGIPFDSYERYRVTAQVVVRLSEGRDDRFRLLDVGGHFGSLKHFVETHRVVVADPKEPPPFVYRESVPARWDAYVRAAGGALPFADASFDVVTAQDTLEHVPPGDRARFIRDALRVSRGFVILNGPVETGGVAEAERRLARYWERLQPWERHPLEEHLELGLPSRGWLESVLDGLGVSWVSIPNGNLTVWLVMMALKYYVDGLPDAHRLHETLDRTFNQLLAPGDLSEPSYRLAYVIASNAEDAEVLKALREDVVGALRGAAPADVPGLEAVEPLVAALEEHGGRLRGALRSYDEMVGELKGSVEQLRATLRRRQAELDDKKAILVGKKEQVAEKDMAIARRDRLIAERDRRIARLQASLPARLAARARRSRDRVAPWGTRRRGVVAVVRSGLEVLARSGILSFFGWLLSPWRWVRGLVSAPLPAPRVVTGISDEDGPADPYQMWLLENQPTAEELSTKKEEAGTLPYRPLVSILMPTYNSEPAWLAEAIDSVRGQVYENWELCVADDGSTRRETREILRRYRRGDRRIRVTFLPRNQGIAVASARALGEARGEFVGLLDHDDVLQPDALLEVVKLLNEQRHLDYLYTDEDKLELDGRRTDPFFKPEWSPDLLLSLNYVTHFSVFRKEIVERVGGFRRGYEGSQDYDLQLRVTEATDRIGHVPRPVYSWRKLPGSAAESDAAKPYAYDAAKRAIAEALERRDQEGDVMDGAVRGYYRVRYRVRGRPKVSIIVPTRDRVDLLRRCVESVRERTTYSNYELVVVDNDSTDPETLDYLARLQGRVIRYPGAFNFAGIVNMASEGVEGEMLLLLNNDTEVVSGEWLEAMLEHGQRPEVGAVGARLLFPDGTPQHEGILVGPGRGLAGNLDTGGYFLLGEVIRDCSAVTAACMLVRTAVFRELGGFEERLAVAYNDVDFCLRAGEKGYRVVYTPYATLYHHEGATRGREGRTHPVDEERFFRRRWSGYVDPYYNPNLDIDHPFRLKVGTGAG